MSERTVELDQPVVTDEAANALREATDRAERAEMELARLKAQQREHPSTSPRPETTSAPEARDERHESAPQQATESRTMQTDELKQPPSPNTAENAPDGATGNRSFDRGSANRAMSEGDGVDELRKDPMMAHLLDSLDAGTDIGHYGRLVFAMVARHFLPHEQVRAWLTKDNDFSDDQAQQMLHQVEGRDYSPPRRERLLEWQSEQEFQFIDPSDPDSGNLYRNLKFPQEIYEHIGHYQDAKASS
ncbi:hypothetical protein [Terriglobus aquaticus]|uniref:Uncharacterized protein n=1 Tax=Terriglobus aquaticus TaxID=940139 RepID=A0ABW9KNX1_9BACT|nr:hypothetical protein [Terriglobus aquaticus]